MAFPATVTTQSKAYTESQAQAASLKTYLQSANAQMAAGPVSCNLVVEIYLALVAAKAKFDATAAVPGIAPYAKDQHNNQALDIVAEFTTMTNAVTACGTWINNNFPKDGAGYLLKDKLDASGVSVRTLSSAQTAGLRTQVDALIATIA